MSWRKHSLALQSKGSQSAKATSLADLHRRRSESQGQFFTPEWISAGIWGALSNVVKARNHIHVMDSSIGTGALMHCAPVDKCNFYGVDTDGRCIKAISDDAQNAELEFVFNVAGMESIEARDMDLCLLNPPFSVHIESPNLFPYACTSYGKFGPNTSAISHEYAIDQALDVANVVVAILPVTMLDYCASKNTGAEDEPSLTMVASLPNDVFAVENANVKTAVFFFSKGHAPVETHAIKGPECEWPSLIVDRKHLARKGNPRFVVNGVDTSKQIITLPVTGDKRVDLHHHNRRVVLEYHCGGTQARVENGLLMKPAIGVRLPKSIKYSGDGKLLIDIMLLQDDPAVQLERLCDEIVQHGGKPVISATLSGFYKKLVKRHARAIVPKHRMVEGGGESEIVLTAKRRMMLDPKDFNSPSVAKDEVVRCCIVDGLYQLEKDGTQVTLRSDEVGSRYTVTGEQSGGDDWRVLHPGLWNAFPELATMYRKQLANLGADKWLADFQNDSAVEMLISPYGGIGAHMQGAGKTRSGLALCLAHSGCNMFVVESGLIPELLREIKLLGIPDHLWKRVQRRNDMPDAKINIVSYGDLRAGISVPAIGKRKARIVKTNAERWRQKINFMVCDEGGLLANSDTQQSKAIRQLSVRKNTVYDGTPIRNYVVNLLPICVATAGNGVAHQPYGIKGNAFIEKRMITSVDYAMRGEDAFFDDFVVTEWVTSLFKEDLTKGAKRQVPKINNLRMFWDWIAPNIQRRVRGEPALAEFNKCPKPIIKTHTVEWDRDHFDHYMRVATEFAQWYVNENKGDGKRLNLVTVLARVNAVVRASNSPHIQSKLSMGTYSPLTSKQRFLINRLKHWTRKGKKVVVYGSSPDVQGRIARELNTAHGIDSVLYTGKQNIASRTKELDDKFRFGDTNVMLATLVANRGLNLPEATVVIFLDRCWSSSEEDQCMYRVLRPSQREQVTNERIHLQGGIDEYQSQLVEWKSRAASAGLDFGLQCGEDEEFLHMDTILMQFCKSILGADFSRDMSKARAAIAA